jgi:hypothetical protein
MPSEGKDPDSGQGLELRAARYELYSTPQRVVKAEYGAMVKRCSEGENRRK